jgi:hypothetical protein
MLKSPKSRMSKSRSSSDQPSAYSGLSEVHLLKPGFICDTESRGYPTPGARSLAEIVVDASAGFIPLWAEQTTLRWRFQSRSIRSLPHSTNLTAQIRDILATALLGWGKAVPVKFTEDSDLWDFEIVVRQGDECTEAGCVLASSFFPDAGRHQLTIFPKMFDQPREEQVDTLTHELGHVFGLRHFFAQISESNWPSEIFGTHSKFSIMNYGKLSRLTRHDRDDLQRLYEQVWAGSLTEINGTPIRLVKPFSATLR